MEKFGKPSLVLMAKWLLWTLAVAWITLGIFSVTRISTGYNEQSITSGIVALLLYINSLVLFFQGWGISRQLRSFFFMSVAFLVFSIVLTIHDQVGFLDIFILFVSGNFMFAMSYQMLLPVNVIDQLFRKADNIYKFCKPI